MDPYGPKRGLPVAVLARREVSRHHDKVSPAKRTPRRSLTTSVPPLGSLTYRSLPNRAAEFDNGEYYSPRPLSFDSTLGYGSFPGGYPPALPPFPLYYPPPYGYPPLIPPYGFGPPPVDYRARSDSYDSGVASEGRRRSAMFGETRRSTVFGETRRSVGGEERRRNNDPRPDCAECDGVRAEVRCTHCGDAFCKACFSVVHGRGLRAGHVWYSLRPPEASAVFVALRMQALLRGRRVRREWPERLTVFRGARARVARGLVKELVDEVVTRDILPLILLEIFTHTGREYDPYAPLEILARQLYTSMVYEVVNELSGSAVVMAIDDLVNRYFASRPAVAVSTPHPLAPAVDAIIDEVVHDLVADCVIGTISSMVDKVLMQDRPPSHLHTAPAPAPSPPASPPPPTRPSLQLSSPPPPPAVVSSPPAPIASPPPPHPHTKPLHTLHALATLVETVDSAATLVGRDKPVLSSPPSSPLIVSSSPLPPSLSSSLLQRMLLSSLLPRVCVRVLVPPNSPPGPTPSTQRPLSLSSRAHTSASTHTTGRTQTTKETHSVLPSPAPSVTVGTSTLPPQPEPAPVTTEPSLPPATLVPAFVISNLMDRLLLRVALSAASGTRP